MAATTRPTGTSDAALERATGHPWSHWRTLLDGWGGSAMDHKTMARRLAGDAGVDGWWAQTLTVRYEQEIGRRQPGQRCTGDHEVGVSTTLAGDMDSVLAVWRAAQDTRNEADSVAWSDAPRVTTTDKWRYWKRDLADGSRVSVNVSAKAGGKALLQVQHGKLADADAADRWRGYWKGELARLKA